jgi:hypothetical protein
MAERGTLLFRGCAAGALALHAALLLRIDGLQGGADLQPHLRLIQLMAENPGIHSVYAPAYHALGAWFGQWVSAGVFTRIFAFCAAAALIAGFRSFQRAANLPDHASAIFAWSPYLFALSWCTPKIEAAGYGLAFWALARVIDRRYALVAIALAGTFVVHTAAALFLGLSGGILVLARRDARGLAALAAGAVLASPLFAAHLAAGCNVAQALMFSIGDYLRRAQPVNSVETWVRIVILAGPVSVVAAAFGAREVWYRNRPIAILCMGGVGLYLNQLWLAPFGVGTTLNLLRGLTVLAFATAIAAGVAIAARPFAAPLVLGACIVWGAVAAVFTVPESCFVRSFSEAEVSRTTVDRCRFQWRKNREVGADDSAESHPVRRSRP